MRSSVQTFTLAVAWFVLSLAPVSAANIINIENHPIMTTGASLSSDDVRKNIILGGLKRHWHMEELGPGELKAVQGEASTRQATIKINYTTSTYSITLLNSVGLDQNGDSISNRYNGWIRYLMQDIDDQLARAAISGN